MALELQRRVAGPPITRPVLPDIAADTHGDVVSGVGQAGAGEKTIGSITLPAGGPWNIWGLWGYAVAATSTPADSIAGSMRIRASSGDIVPNPAPARFPTPMLGSGLGATHAVSMVPLNIWPVNYQAPGKGIIEMLYTNDIALTVAPQIVLGVLFGKTVPSMRPITFIDRVRAAITAAADTSIGTITLAEKATRVTHVGGIMVQDGVMVAGEELTGFFRLASDDIRMPPMNLPFSAVFGAGLGTVIEQPNAVKPLMLPVEIPTPGGARIDCFVDLNTAVTNAAEVQIFIAYE